MDDVLVFLITLLCVIMVNYLK